MVSRALLVFALWAVCALSSRARAQECEADGDCASGFECTGRKQLRCNGGRRCGEGGSSSADPAAPWPNGGVAGCAADPFICELYTVRDCKRPACDSDDDCAPGLSCVARTEHRCPGVDPCPDETSCPVDPFATCAFVETGSCQPPTQTDCFTDADCPSDYECEVTGISCGGCGAGAGGAGGWGGARAAQGECPCRDIGLCALRELPCDGDAACSAPLTCEPNPCRFGSHADAPEHVCRPPEYFSFIGCPGDGLIGTGGIGAPYPIPARPDAGAPYDAGVPHDAGVPAPPSWPGSGRGGAPGSGAGGYSSGAAGASADPNDGGVDQQHPRRHRGLFGCAAAPGTGSGGGGALALYALIALSHLRLRRASRAPRARAPRTA